MDMKVISGRCVVPGVVGVRCLCREGAEILWKTSVEVPVNTVLKRECGLTGNQCRCLRTDVILENMVLILAGPSEYTVVFRQWI